MGKGDRSDLPEVTFKLSTGTKGVSVALDEPDVTEGEKGRDGGGVGKSGWGGRKAGPLTSPQWGLCPGSKSGSPSCGLQWSPG